MANKLSKEELTLLTLAGYGPCTCVSDVHWIHKASVGTVNNSKLYEKDLKKILYGE